MTNIRTNYKYIITTIIAIFPAWLFAAPALNTPIEVQQPNGDKISLMAVGDEKQHRIETTNGFTVLLNPDDKTWYYVLGVENGKTLLSSQSVNMEKPPIGLQKHIQPKTITKSLRNASASKGQINLKTDVVATPKNFTPGVFNTPVLYVLVDYQDSQHVTPASHFLGLSQQVIEYYKVNSFGKANLTRAAESFGASDGIVGWIRLPGNFPTPTNWWEFLTGVLESAMPQVKNYVDFAKFDTDGDGHIYAHELAIVVVVAGHDQRYISDNPAQIWPGALEPAAPIEVARIPDPNGGADKIITYGHKDDGVDYTFNGFYALVAEMQGKGSDIYPSTMGIIAHELGHSIFNLPDMYMDRPLISNVFAYSLGGIGYYGLMGWGYNGKRLDQAHEGESPVLLSAFNRYKLGWLNPQVINQGQINIVASQSSLGNASNSLVRVNTQDPNQYFLIENRQNLGYDQGLQYRYLNDIWAGGLLIWHINDPNRPRRYLIEQQPPFVDIEQKGLSGDSTFTFRNIYQSDFWTGVDITKNCFGSNSVPNSNLYSGTYPIKQATPSGIKISNISHPGNTMTAVVSALAANIANDCGTSNSPILDIGGPYTGEINQEIQFDASRSRKADGSAFDEYEWNFGDGSPLQPTATPIHRYAVAASYNIILRLRDGSQWHSISTTATIKNPPAPILNSGGPYSGETGKAIQFDASLSKKSNGSAFDEYSWDFGDGTIGSTASPQHIYRSAGNFTVTLRLRDGSNWLDAPNTTANVTDVVAPGTPVFDLGGPYIGVAGELMQFDARNSRDANGKPFEEYYWYFGDNSDYIGVGNPLHLYSSPGFYTVIVQMYDGTNWHRAPANLVVEITP